MSCRERAAQRARKDPIALLDVVFFTNQVLAQHDLFRLWEETNTCKAVVFLSLSKLVKKVAKLHFSTLDAELMVLEMETASTSTIVFGIFYGYLLSGSLDAVKEFGQDDMWDR